MRVLILVGSSRSDSLNRQLALEATDLLPPGVGGSTSGLLTDLPLYDQGLDTARPPEAVMAFRAEIARADRLLLVTPEHNASVPAVLKNAVDWASRPRGAAALQGKRCAVVGASPSPHAAAHARRDLIRILTVAGADPLAASVGVCAGGGGSPILRHGAVVELRNLLRELVTPQQQNQSERPRRAGARVEVASR